MDVTPHADDSQSVLTIWQIDSFEGGKGSRADFIQKAGVEYSKQTECFISVVSISAQSARLNLSEGNLPDIISYGAGMYGLESYVSSYNTWCYGGYCILTLETNSDFSDVNAENTIINTGKDNLIDITALFCGLQNATHEKSTGAYVKLINGEYKYLLGTQRDIYRLKTRGAVFAVKPVNVFNDLYQNISVISDGKRATIAQTFVNYFLAKTSEVTKLGMMSETAVYDDEMRLMQGQSYEYKLTSPISLQTHEQIEKLISTGDINMLKNLLK